MCLHCLLCYTVIHITGPTPSLTGKSGTHPLFLQLNTDFSAQNNPFFVIKQTFQSTMNPLFCGKTWTFQPQNNPIFTVKHDIKINLLFPKFTEVSTKIPLFSRKMQIWISSKNTLLLTNFRTRMGVVE